MSDASSRRPRILLKVSGEVLMGDGAFGIDLATLDAVASDIAEVVASGVELCLVIGGGNIFRGLSMAGKAYVERIHAAPTTWACWPP